jgi:hypothetical protein
MDLGLTPQPRKRTFSVPNALITGSSARAREVAAALQIDDWQPQLCADSAEALEDVRASTPPGSFDCYIQLPSERRAHTTAMSEASGMVADGALARYAAVTTVMPLLSEAAAVVLVMGEGSDGLPRDLAGAVNDLTRVLARALRNDYRATDLRVTLVGDDQSPSEIASVARSGKGTPTTDWYADFEPALGSADWRCEVLSLVEPT